MTPDKVIERADSLRPNIYDTGIKLDWVMQAENLVETSLGRAAALPTGWPDTELQVPAPFDTLYIHYLMAKMDLYDRDYSAYNSMALVFNRELEAYCKHILRQACPASPGGYRL